MTKDPNVKAIHAARKEAHECLESLKIMLVACIDGGMQDPDDVLYNELLDLIDDSHVLETWDELVALIDKAQNIEDDVDTWLAQKGRSTLSLQWPVPPV